MNIEQVFGARVLIEKARQNNKTASGLDLDDESNNKTLIAKIVAVGNGVENNIQVGDMIFYAEYDLMEIDLGSEKVYVLDEEDVIGKIK
jgi:co-chaperonin GroES (HSP10)